jgi:hypothetical protein
LDRWKGGFPDSGEEHHEVVSLHALKWAFEQEIKPTAKLVLLAIADHVSEKTGECWVGIPLLMKKTGLSLRGVQTTCKSLEVLGLLEVTKRFTDSRQTTNLWKVPSKVAGRAGGDGTKCRGEVAGDAPLVNHHSEPKENQPLPLDLEQTMDVYRIYRMHPKPGGGEATRRDIQEAIEEVGVQVLEKAVAMAADRFPHLSGDDRKFHKGARSWFRDQEWRQNVAPPVDRAKILADIAALRTHLMRAQEKHGHESSQAAIWASNIQDLQRKIA